MQWRNLGRFFGKVLKQPRYAVQVGIKRSKAYLSYYLGQGNASFPESITLFLTHHCNLRCKMCGQWGETGVTKTMPEEHVKEGLTFKELQRIIDDLSGFRPNITLFGGEPLLHSHCMDLIHYIKKKGMHCLMITNGSLVKTRAEELIHSGLDELNVSIDGGRELHDHIRGVPGLFDRVVDGLKHVTEMKKKNNNKTPMINVQCTISNYNVNHLEQMTGVAEEIGADSLTFHNLIFMSEKLLEQQHEFDKMLGCSSKNWEGFVFEPHIDPEVLHKNIQKIMSGQYRFSVDVYPNFSFRELKEYYQNPDFVSEEYSSRCISPWMVAYIFPDGELRPCLNFDYSFGNVKGNTFSRLWNGDRAVSFRRTLKKNSTFPVCVRCTELYRY
jgi:MoaA/NifB/PqqE/SkfB family radical SAM enzyme